MRIKFTHLIIISLFVISGVLAYDAFTSYINPYLSLTQVMKNIDVYLNKEIQLLGIVVIGSSKIDNGSLLFNITDNEFTIRVTYKGSLPQNFMEGEQVVTIGKLVSSDYMEASQILVKCPSKYESGSNSLFSEPVILAAILLGSVTIGYFVISIVSKKE